MSDLAIFLTILISTIMFFVVGTFIIWKIVQKQERIKWEKWEEWENWINENKY